MGLTGIRGLQPARTATLRPHAPALDDETLGTKPKCFMQSQGDALGSSGSAVLGVRSWAAAAARVPRDGAPSASDAFPQTNGKKGNAAFPSGRAARAAPIASLVTLGDGQQGQSDPSTGAPRAGEGQLQVGHRHRSRQRWYIL